MVPHACQMDVSFGHTCRLPKKKRLVLKLLASDVGDKSGAVLH